MHLTGHFPLDSIIDVGPYRDTLFVPIISDNPSWTVNDRPGWFTERKLNADTLMVIVGENENYYPREGFANIKSGDRVSSVWIRQEARDMPSFMGGRIVDGRDISFGVKALCRMPFVCASSGGDYAGSVVDYGLGTADENASYTSAFGYAFGVLADVRLFRNVFLTAGLDFAQTKFENHFNRNTALTIPFNKYECLKGEVRNSYTEKYSLTFLELPIMASYCFKIGPASHFRVNAGTVLSFGLTSRMSLNGNTDGETLKMYDSVTDR